MSATVKEPNYGMDKLSSEIFSILESKFLFGGPDDMGTCTPKKSFSPAVSTPSTAGKVRVLSVDAGGATEGLLAASSLALLESSLQLITSNPSARIPDFFDIAAGSGIGGLLVSLLFTTTPSGHLRSAAEALRFLSKNHSAIVKPAGKKSTLLSVFGGKKKRGPSAIFRSLFGDLTLRDTVKPVLVPCYDLSTGAPFVFSRADAVETDGYDFKMREVCEATMGVAEKKMRSVDGRTTISVAAVDGGVTTGNPSSAAITHVLNNKMEFPSVKTVEDLFLVSVGNGEAGGFVRQPGYSTPSPAGLVKIAGDGVSDMIDQAVGLAFGQCGKASYVRIQGREQSVRRVENPTVKNPTERMLRKAEEMLAQRNVESVLFCGKKLSEKTNAEKLDWAAGELVEEGERRKRSPFPVVAFKRGSPHSSSSSSSAVSSSTCSP